jgi:hypothetical protein
MLFLAASSCRWEMAMAQTRLENVILWGVLGAAAGGAPAWMTFFYGGTHWSIVLVMVTFIALLGSSAGSLAFYTWPARTTLIAFGLGAVGCFLALAEAFLEGFAGASLVTHQILAVFGGAQTASTVYWLGSAIVAGVVYQVALLAVLLVIRQLYRWGVMGVRALRG